VPKFALILFLLSVPATAQSITANTVRDICKPAPASNAEHLQCSGYVRGVLDTNQLWYAAMVKEKHFGVLTQFYCAPDGLKASDAVALFVDYLAQNSTFGEQPAANVIVLALRNKYPCR
jgi:hypothetical protein